MSTYNSNADFKKSKEYKYGDNMNFSTGDIIYAKIHHAGCSYSHRFAIVIKITKGGRFRVQLIGNEYYGEREGHYNFYQKVKPNPAHILPCKTELIGKDGYKKYWGTDGTWYKKYADTMTVKNYSDLGD